MSLAGRADGILVELFREQRAGLWSFYRSAAGSDPPAEELLQETFVRMWEQRGKLSRDPGFDDAPALKRWLWRVARNLMIDEIRARQRMRARLGEAPREVAASPTSDGPTAMLIQDEARRILRGAVAEMPNERARRCLELWLEGNDYRGIADRMRLDVGQVRGLLQRSREEVIREAAARLEGRSRGGSER